MLFDDDILFEKTWVKGVQHCADMKTIKHWLRYVVQNYLVVYPICPMRFIESIQTNPNTVSKFQFEEIFVKTRFKGGNQA